MDLELWKKIKKEKKLTLQEISNLSEIPKRTIEDIFSGKTPTPRTNTVQAIEKALGINENKIELSEEKKNLLEKIDKMTKEEKQALISFIDLMLSKRN